MNRRIHRQLPHFESVPLAVGLGWHGGGDWRFEEKIDGVFCEADASGIYLKNSCRPLPAPLPELSDVRLAGEFKDGTLHAFDIISAGNRPLWRLPLIDRLEWLARAGAHFPSWIVPIRHGTGGEFLELILSEGGEGIISKNLGSFWGKMGAWIKCKREQTEDCTVTARNAGKPSARIFQGRIDCGSVRVPDHVRAGDIIEVRCHSRHPSGKLREAFFVRRRDDKTSSQDLRRRG